MKEKEKQELMNILSKPITLLEIKDVLIKLVSRVETEVDARRKILDHVEISRIKNAIYTNSSKQR
ncbi:hypothetical protein QU593_10340 [Rossellomorea marisflavi]|uniref:hypothetical protein n=1 Tax=Rossellomorea marisflavi TaxID=189381 RepID=UPI0025AF2393|nr:hypothetical protein [Rossellomorea marisflavi]WJV20804.1 hypothetical protein QU593_10340 [Rossellomorea marisflavi]